MSPLQRISLTCGRGSSVSDDEGCLPRARTVNNNRETALTAKTDEEVGLILGPMLGAWEPLPLQEIVKSANPPTTSTNGCVVSTLSICAFLAVTVAAIASGVYFKSVVVGFVVAFGLAIPITMLAARFSRIAHLRTRLGVFERGMRCGRSVIRFDELKVTTFGAPRTFAER
ncbi:hypothetical protein Fuma_03364 [Fuerstiella marisgermanici]|uniref:Uncharacterized protein n=1 Tax=Fuerstiella marisgermanici TaxID=1891926 RepID=A0A1P8WI60_9PLAN|nr:hypothetical protein Fuma_03364 [Fuerstiella marisgermanici]